MINNKLVSAAKIHCHKQIYHYFHAKELRISILWVNMLLLPYIIDFVNLRKLISAYRLKLFGQKPKFEQVHLLGKEMMLYTGIINKKADKDDAWWYALSQRYEQIFDIGANVGYSAILACIHNPDKSILLVDPNTDAIAVAKTNLEINGLGKNKQYINAFVSDSSGAHVKFFTLGTGSAGSMYSSHADSAGMVNAYSMVETMMLDDIVDMTGITPDLIKVDVEAAESFVLGGATKLATQQVSVFLIEMHGPEEMPMVKNAGLILEWCRTNSYKAYYMKDHVELTSVEQIAHRGRCHLLLLPVNVAYPEYLNRINEGDEIE
ncbi:MAG: FkbM family methyltransferase [Chitinophagales bacterium]|nr:FkbM family methyltransferase [Chitinophagaceae bacterium]MCB9066074.1 FkbM family methyltransferase [Chitinophagales bacterium]